MPLTVTAQANGATRMMLAVRVLKGASGLAGTTGTTTAATSLAMTPQASGSLVYGGLSSIGHTWPYTPFSAATAILGDADAGGNGQETVALVSAALTTAGTPVTLGVTAGGELGEALALCEILAASGMTLAEDASTPAVVPVNGSNSLSVGTSLATAAFSPPPGAVLVAIAIASASQAITSVTDSSEGAYAWAEAASAGNLGFGNATVWIGAPVFRYVLTNTVTVPAGTPATPAAFEPQTGGPAGYGNAATTGGPNWPATFYQGQVIALSPASPLFAAIGAANLRRWVDGQDSYRGGVSN